jgi:hypothetical protein
MTALALVEETWDDNEHGREQACVYVACRRSAKIAGPVWGHGTPSVTRALVMLTRECLSDPLHVCRATFHQRDPSTHAQPVQFDPPARIAPGRAAGAPAAAAGVAS